MFNPRTFDDLTKRLVDALPSGVKEIHQDLEKTLHTVLQNNLSKLDLVSREEFDVQCAVLARTRQKIEALEKRLQELEQHLDIPQNNGPAPQTTKPSNE